MILLKPLVPSGTIGSPEGEAAKMLTHLLDFEA
jgi:hypothetical protein